MKHDISHIYYRILIATPITCILIGLLAYAIDDHAPNDDGSDLSPLIVIAGIVIGILGFVVSFVTGTTAKILLDQTKHERIILWAYAVPAGLAVLLTLSSLVG